MRRIILLSCVFAFGAAEAAACLPEGSASAGSAAELAVATSALEVADSGNRRLVTTLGKITNPSASCFEEVVLELSYFDKDGKLIDTTTKELHGLIVPAKTDVNYRVTEPATRPGDQYASQKVRLINAEHRYARQSQQKEEPGLLISLISNWGPMLLLIVVWMVAMRKYMGSRSPQYRTLAILEKQAALSEAHLKALERVAAALESRSKLPEAP